MKIERLMYLVKIGCLIATHITLICMFIDYYFL